MSQETQISHTSDIVSAYVSNNPVSAAELVTLIENVNGILVELSSASKHNLRPAVPVSKTIQKDHLVCLECGEKRKTLKRHLNTYHDLTPQEYRNKWNLPANYPIVAATYSGKRTELAKKFKLGKSAR